MKLNIQFTAERPYGAADDELSAWINNQLGGRFEMVESVQWSRDATCTWTQDGDGIWQTSCGEGFVFDCDGPTGNKLKFCCYCGKALVEATA